MSTTEQHALALKVSLEWQEIFSTLGLTTIDDANVVDHVVTKLPYDNFFSGKIALLNYLIDIVDDDVKKYTEEGRTILDELDDWRAIGKDMLEIIDSYVTEEYTCNGRDLKKRIIALLDH